MPGTTMTINGVEHTYLRHEASAAIALWLGPLAQDVQTVHSAIHWIEENCQQKGPLGRLWYPLLPPKGFNAKRGQWLDEIIASRDRLTRIINECIENNEPS